MRFCSCSRFAFSRSIATHSDIMGMLRSLQDMDGAPHFGSWETFTAVDAGSGQAGFPDLAP